MKQHGKLRNPSELRGKPHRLKDMKERISSPEDKVEDIDRSEKIKLILNSSRKPKSPGNFVHYEKNKPMNNRYRRSRSSSGQSIGLFF